MSDRYGGGWGQRKEKLRQEKQEVNLGASTLTHSLVRTRLSRYKVGWTVSELGVGVAF